MCAREVEIERGKVKFSTPLMHSEINLNDVPYWVLFVDAGQRMHKVKQSKHAGGGRPGPLACSVELGDMLLLAKSAK